ncbi:MAG: hypothetical protein AB7H90_03470 [Alphaproteobacteria bacterium]
MPKIREYNAPTRRLNPSDRASQAWETAGRRFGPLYNQAAQDIKEAGRVRGAMERAKIWPFNVYALRERNAEKITNTTSENTRTSQDSGGGGGGAKLIDKKDDGGWGDYYKSLRRSGAGGYYEHDPGALENESRWEYSHGEASAGAVGMSRLARSLADTPPSYYNGQYETVGEDGIPRTPYQQDKYDTEVTRMWQDALRTAKRNNDETAAIQRRQAAQEQKYLDRFYDNRDKWLGDHNEAWQKSHDSGQDRLAREFVDTWNTKYPDDKKSYSDPDDRAFARDAIRTVPAEQSTIGRYEDENPDYRIRYGTPTTGDYVRYAPRAIVDGVKGVIDRISGNRSPEFYAEIPRD